MAKTRLFRISTDTGDDFYAEGVSPEAALRYAIDDGQTYDEPVEVFEQIPMGRFAAKTRVTKTTSIRRVAD